MQQSLSVHKPFKWNELLPVAGVFLLLMVLFHGGAVYGTLVFCGGDIINQDHPLRQYWLREGFLTGWYSASFSGYPFFANTQAGVLYPPNLLYWIGLPVERATTWLMLLHSLGGALGFYALARGWMSRLAALLPGFLWLCGGYQILRYTNGVVIFTFGMNWIPWMWLAAERCGPGARRWTILLGLLGAMQFLAGAPQLVHITWGGLLIWLTGRTVFMKSWRDRGLLAAHVAAAVVLMVVIVFPQLYASWEFSSLGAGRGADGNWSYIAQDSFSPRLLIAILLPTFFDIGNAEMTYWGGTTGYLETNVYIGVGALLLALFGFVFVATGILKRTHENGVHKTMLRLSTASIVLAISGMLIAFGRHFFLYRLLFDFVPGFDMFRVPSRWQLWWVAPAILFSGFGLQALLDAAGEGIQSRTGRKTLIIWGAVFGAGTLACAALRIATPALLGFFEFHLVERFHMSQSLADAAWHRAERAGEWALGIVAITGVVGTAIILRPTGRNALLLALALVFVTDLRLFWTPFTRNIPTDIPGPELPTESPYHRIKASEYSSYFHPETEILNRLHDNQKGRLFFTDSLYHYGVDEFVRELYADRPAEAGIASMRGYYPLLLRSYVDDFFAVAYGEEMDRPPPGAFLACPLIMNRWPLDAYNADQVLRFRTPKEPPQNTDQLRSAGLEKIDEFGYSGEYGTFILERWENPRAAGWAWLSSQSEWPGLDDRVENVTLENVERDADHTAFDLTVPVDVSGDVFLHFAEVAYPGWTILINEEPVAEGRSVRMNAAPGETLRVERQFALPGPTRLGLPVAGAAVVAALVGLFLPQRKRRQETRPAV